MSIDVTRSGTPLPLSVRVAEEIRVMLARRRMSGRELARRLDVSPSWVNYRLTGAQPIDLNDLERISEALGVTVFDLIPRSAGQSDITPRYAQVDQSDEVEVTQKRSDRTRPGGVGRPPNVPSSSRRPSFLRKPIPA
jgi:transcriptional regulator with XRE-family HTH domain